MSRKYKFLNKNGLYFVSFATVYWLDVFIRHSYFNEIIKSLKFCIDEKGMELYAYCIMTSHVHLIYRATDSNPGELIKSFKQFTSKKLQESISENIQESKKEWMVWIACPV